MLILLFLIAASLVSNDNVCLSLWPATPTALESLISHKEKQNSEQHSFHLAYSDYLLQSLPVK